MTKEHTPAKVLVHHDDLPGWNHAHSWILDRQSRREYRSILGHRVGRGAMGRPWVLFRCNLTDCAGQAIWLESAMTETFTDLCKDTNNE